MNDEDSKNSTKINRTNKSSKSDNTKGSNLKRKRDALPIVKNNRDKKTDIQKQRSRGYKH